MPEQIIWLTLASNFVKPRRVPVLQFVTLNSKQSWGTCNKIKTIKCYQEFINMNFTVLFQIKLIYDSKVDSVFVASLFLLTP
ncbi:unnamed protein product [Blumeria hordei]|uniref:Uncharacterized protein n=1 Tax=Blumeria hordei TaxID=2867405 RepID=A0A383UR83_BLUHO|nr:unnamed protein product [Blumeria hordei]